MLRNECIALGKPFILPLSCINSSTKSFQRNFEYTDIYTFNQWLCDRSINTCVARG